MMRDDELTERRVPALLVLAAVVSANLFVAALVVTALTPGGEDTTDTATAERVVAAQDLAPADDRAKAAAEVIETFEVFGAKNPFERPLSLQIATTPPDDDPLAVTTLPDPSTGGERSTTTTLLAPSRGSRVQLSEIYAAGEGTVANLVVDSELYEAVGEGDIFANVYQVIELDLATQCGQFLVGDVDFELCVGQEILK